MIEINKLRGDVWWCGLQDEYTQLSQEQVITQGQVVF